MIALHNSTPAFYVRQPTDTCKGQMYRDFGANDWFFEVDETSGPEIWSRLSTIHRDPAKEKAKVKSIMAKVEDTAKAHGRRGARVVPRLRRVKASAHDVVQ